MSYFTAVYHFHAFYIINKLTNFVLYIYIHGPMKTIVYDGLMLATVLKDFLIIIIKSMQTKM
jgi:hypothetical protein